MVQDETWESAAVTSGGGGEGLVEVKWFWGIHKDHEYSTTTICLSTI